MTSLLAMSGIGDFFTAIMTPLHAAMSFVIMWAYRFWSMLLGPDLGVTWAVSIMTLTVIVRSILIPLFVRQINSARNMQLIQPKMRELQEKYAADREKLGIETQKLMKAEGVNPMASCFPMLLQMPVFFALYQVLYAAANGRALGYFFVHNPDLVNSLTHASIFGARLADHFWLSNWSQFGATQIMAIILVLIMSGLLFITQKQLMGKNMPPEALTGPMAQQQKMMVYLFPIMYLFMGTIIPVGVLVYWVTNNLWTLGQQFILIHNNPTPGTPAYIEWEERMIKKGRDPKEIAEQRRAKRSHKSTQPTSSRTVGGSAQTSTSTDQGSSTDSGSAKAGSPDTPSTGVVRQQIQRQQPSRQSRSTRATPKKPNKK
ncbi:MAG: membrane protein insertase YidC [Propionibacteriaceae bacterium]|nr:membrane protein insertase YidC [Propionibacteriaceae bacterium]